MAGWDQFGLRRCNYGCFLIFCCSLGESRGAAVRAFNSFNVRHFAGIARRGLLSAADLHRAICLPAIAKRNPDAETLAKGASNAFHRNIAWLFA